MCQPKPGPRCSNHAREAKEKAKAEYEECKKSGGMNQARVQQLGDEYLLATYRYDATPEGLKKINALVEVKNAEFDKATAEADAYRERFYEKLRITKPDIPEDCYEDYVNSDIDYLVLKEKKEQAEIETIFAKTRQHRAQNTYDFDRKALKFETERMKRVAVMEDLADKGDLKGLKAAYEEYDKDGFNNPPVSFHAQMTQIPNTMVHTDEETGRGVYTDVFTVDTTNKGKVSVEVVNMIDEENGQVHRTSTTKILKPGVTSTRTKNQKRRGPEYEIEMETVQDTFAESNLYHHRIEQKIKKVGEFESKLYYRELFRKCRDNAEKRSAR